MRLTHVLILLFGLPAHAEVIFLGQDDAFSVHHADQRLHCYSQDRDDDGIEESAELTLDASAFGSNSPIALNGHEFRLRLSQNGAEICRLAKELVKNARELHPGTGPTLTAKISTVLEIDQRKLTEMVKVRIFGNDEKKGFSFESKQTKNLTR